MLYRNSDKYEGEWESGKREGTGNLTYSNDENIRKLYFGQWKHDQPSGKGILLGKNGDQYDGQFKNNLRYGFGVQIYANGDNYEGHWKDDVKSGKGNYVWNHGVKYVGNWRNGERHGYGTEFSSRGNEIRRGIWSADKFVQPL